MADPVIEAHIAILTRDMGRFIRFYQAAFDATVVHDNRVVFQTWI